jgi:fructokinase
MTFGGIEAGGTKFNCVIGAGPDDILVEERIPTEDPSTTLAATIAFFRDHIALGTTIDALGIASFGPLELRPGHPQYGFITTTPKPGWSGTDFVGPLSAALGVPVGFDTDVNGAALAEGLWGATRGCATHVYFTIGTGIGGGAIVNGAPVHGVPHPEMGHLIVPREEGDTYPGHCPFHRDCFEGMASGPAMEERWGQPADTLTDDALARAVAMEAGYIASGVRNAIYAIGPERVVIGGGVSHLPGLFPEIRRRLEETLAAYPGCAEHGAENFLVPPALGDRAGAAGALALAARVAGQSASSRA